VCDPVTLTVAATAVTALGTGYSGLAKADQHKYQAGVARNNATQARNQAADAEERGKRDELVKGREVSAAKSAQMASFAANGLDTTFGSPLDVVTDTAIFGGHDAWQIRDNAAREATGFMISAQNYEEEARAQGRARRNALISTAFDMTSTVIGGAAQVKGMQAPRSSAKAPAASSPFSMGSSLGAAGGAMSGWGR
jgi:hypothetical protein